ncbi:MAG: flagellar export chaperone FliS [Candidatus Pristimantibacillus sp.]
MIVPNPAGYQTYQKNKFETASPHKLILMLYEGLLRFGTQTIKMIEQNNIAETNRSVQKMQDILYELITVLNTEQGGEIAENLKNLYLYMIDQLVQANVGKDAEKVKEVMQLITEIKKAWEEIGKGVSVGYA